MPIMKGQECFPWRTEHSAGQNFKKETLAQIMNVRDGDMKTFRENSAMEVLTALRSYVEDMKLQQMHVALAISKCDELRSTP